MQDNSFPSSFQVDESIVSIKTAQTSSKYEIPEIILSLLQIGNNNEDEQCFLCKECQSTPLIQFQSLKNITFSCKCENRTNISLKINDLIREYSIKKELCKDSLECNIHDNNKFKYYCLIHGKDMCEDCQKEHDCDKANIKNLNEEKSILDNEMIPFIAKSLLNKSNNNFDANYLDNDILIILITSILNEYYEYPNYNTLVNIKNFYFKLNNVGISEKKVFGIENNIEIKSQMQYEALNNDKKQYIKKIEIVARNSDIIFLNNAKLINLEELNLESNNIDNIEPLINCEFNNLKILNLSLNRLDDRTNKVLAKLNYNNLEDLNLRLNYFTQFDLFKSLEHFKKLKKLNLFSNKFTEDIEDLMKDKNLKYNLQSIEEIDLSLGIFSEKSIKLISKFIFGKLETLNLSSNNLISLSFIDYLKYEKENDSSDNSDNSKNYRIIKNKGEYPLKKLFLMNNEISDISKLINLKNLKEVGMQNNSIIINQSVNNIVEKMKSLEKILLFGNKLDSKNP